MRISRPISLFVASLAMLAAPLQAADEPKALPAPPALDRAECSLAGALLFDEPGDGALWVLGGTSYKARFAADGVTYYPYLGADAPRSEPLHLELLTAERGGSALELERSEPERDGTSVLYDRGALVELYELRSESMEQMFVIERLQGAGDLVLRVGIDTELTGLQTNSGLRFDNERGGATYSRAIAFDARGEDCPVTTSWMDGVVELRVSAQALDSLELPLLIDPVIQTFGVTSLDELHYSHSDVAYDAVTERFAVAFARRFSDTDTDVLMSLYDIDGAYIPNSQVAVDLTTDCWIEPRVASNGFAAQFLTVANTSPNCVAASLIEGRTRQAASNFQGAPFVISGLDPAFRAHPDVGGSPSNLSLARYCVVWQRIAGGDTELEYEIVEPDGTLGFNSPQPLAVGASLDEYPAISNTCGSYPTAHQDWTVTWEHRSSAGADRDVWGAQIHWTGAITTPPFEIDGSAFEDTKPQPSSPLTTGSDGKHTMVVWERADGVDPDVWGAVVVADQVLAPPVNLSLVEGGEFVAQHQSRPVVDSDGTSFTVAYREHFFGNPSNRNVYVSTFRWLAGELVPIETHVPTGISLADQDLPAIATVLGHFGSTPDHPGRSMISWQEHRPIDGTWAIEGALYENAESTAAGIPLCFGDGSSSPCPCGNQGMEGVGCQNSTGAGAHLSALGTNRSTADDLQLVVENALPGQPGLFFQGNVMVADGNGVFFGDGLRCCGAGVVRLQVAVTSPAGAASTSVPIAELGGVDPGDTRCYQFWYRDPIGGGVCGAGFNLTNAYGVLWNL